jgi:hypothetical protein
MSDGERTRVNQVALSRNPEQREVATLERGKHKPYCPDCGTYVGASKSGGKPLPETDATAFGWECQNCNLTLPSTCHGASAPMFNSSMAGIEVEFRDGETRWVPVPARYAEEEIVDA